MQNGVRIEDILKQVKGNVDFKVFLSQIDESSLILLTTHKTDLLTLDGRGLLYSLPFSGEDSDNEQQVIEKKRVLEYLVAKEMDSDVINSFLSIIGLEDGSESYENMIDIIAYSLIQWVRTQEDIKELIVGSEFSYPLMKEKLGNIQERLQSSESDTVSEELSDIDDVAKEKIQSVFSQISKRFDTEGFEIIISLSRMLPNFGLLRHLLIPAWHLKILEIIDLGYEEYHDCLNALYLHKLIDHTSTVLWCESCGIEQPSYTEIHGRIAPEKIQHNTCVKCGRNMSFTALYEMTDDLRSAMSLKDGFLSLYFAWCLESEEIGYKCNYHSSKYEIDFIIGDVLIECKTIRARTAEDNVALRSELSKAITQIENHAKDLEENGEVLSSAFLLWNFYDSGDSSDDIRSAHLEFLEKYEFEVYDISSIDKLIARLKKK